MSGVYIDHPFLRPGMKLQCETFEAIHHLGLLANTEEDAYTVLSLFEDIMPFGGETVVIDFLLSVCKARKYKPGTDPSKFKGLGCFKEDYTGGNESSSAFGFTMPSTNSAAPEPAFGTKRTDYEYIDTAITFFGADETIFGSMADTIHQEHPYITPDAIEVALRSMFKRTHRFERVINNKELDVFEFEGKKNGTGRLISLVQGQGGNKRLFVLRAWVDQFTDDDSFFTKQESGTDHRFKSSPLENAMTDSCYSGMRPRDLILPGMTLMRPMNRTDRTLNIMPQVFKVFAAHSDPNKDLLVPNPDKTSKVPELKWNNGQHDNACYMSILIDRVKEYGFPDNWTTPVVLAGDENKHIRVECIKQYMTIFSPSQSEKNFHTYMSRDTFDEDDYIPYPQSSILRYEKTHEQLSVEPDALPSISEDMYLDNA